MPDPIVIKQRSLAEQIQPGVEMLLQTLQQRRQQAMRQQQLAIQQQQLALQGLSMRAQERERVTQRAFELMDMLGPDILQDPQVAAMLDEGVGQGASKSIMKRWEARNKEQEDALTVARQALQTSVPQSMSKGMDIFFKSIDAGLGQDAATTAMREAFKQNPPNEQELARLAREWPELFGPDAGIPYEDAMTELVALRAEEASIRAQFGPGWRGFLDAEIKKTRLALNQSNLAEIIEGKDTSVTASQRMSAAMGVYRILSQDLAENELLYNMQFSGKTFNGKTWRRLSSSEKIRVLYGARMGEVWDALPTVYTELGGLEEFIPLDENGAPKVPWLESPWRAREPQ
jgi:hypothetical protein